jgi:uncharacterized protein (TIGR02594 family)
MSVDPITLGHRWMTCAEGMIGLSEIKGPRHESRIVAMWDAIHCSWFRDDEVPWCAGFVGSVLENSGIRSTRSAAARSYEKWGAPIERRALGWAATPIPYGAVMVLESPGRGPGSGHVTFFRGPSGAGWAGLGGNQNDAVRVSNFLWSRIVAVRWPTGYALPSQPYRFPAPIKAAFSTSDA